MIKLPRVHVLVCLFLLALFGYQPTSPTQASASLQDGLVLHNPPLKYIMIGEPSQKEPGPPPPSFAVTAPATADIQVIYNGIWPAPAQTAFEYAVTLWESQIESSVPIVVDAKFSTTLPSDALGGAGPTNFHANFTNAPLLNTWYPTALANALSGNDLNGATAEIQAEFNANVDWYYGTDENPPFSQFDFVSVVLHEIAHGLGFTDSFDVSGSTGSWGLPPGAGLDPLPFVYDRFVENGGGQLLLTSFPNNSTTLGNQLQSSNLFFDGPEANSANGSRPKLYAPNPFQRGSSIAHLDLSTFSGTANSLMTPSIANGEAEHGIGPVSLAIFNDLGWSSSSSPPVFMTIPNTFVGVGETVDNAIDLWAYAEDPNSADSELTFSLVSSSNADAGVSLDSNRYLDINPTGGFAGQTTVTVQVSDPGSLSDTTSFVIVFSDEVFGLYLPFMNR